MQLVIELSEEDLDDIKNNDYIDGTYYTMFDAITNGIPLPKGHGRLIDADALMRDYGNSDIKILLDIMDTIIEADRSEEKENG